MATKYRGANSKRHQRPYNDNLNLTDRPVGYGPYRGDGSMDVLDMDTMAKAEGSTARFPQSENSAMTKRDNG